MGLLQLENKRSIFAPPSILIFDNVLIAIDCFLYIKTQLGSEA